MGGNAHPLHALPGRVSILSASYYSLRCPPAAPKLRIIQMLNEEQKSRMITGFSKGLSDPMIARKLGLSHMQVFNFRKAQEISSHDVKQNRYREWIARLERGDSLEMIASEYHVKPLSIRQALWREKGFSIREAKKRGKRAPARHTEQKEKSPP